MQQVGHFAQHKIHCGLLQLGEDLLIRFASQQAFTASRGCSYRLRPLVKRVSVYVPSRKRARATRTQCVFTRIVPVVAERIRRLARAPAKLVVPVGFARVPQLATARHWLRCAQFCGLQAANLLSDFEQVSKSDTSVVTPFRSLQQGAIR